VARMGNRKCTQNFSGEMSLEMASMTMENKIGRYSKMNPREMGYEVDGSD